MPSSNLMEESKVSNDHTEQDSTIHVGELSTTNRRTKESRHKKKKLSVKAYEKCLRDLRALQKREPSAFKLWYNNNLSD